MDKRAERFEEIDSRLEQGRVPREVIRRTVQRIATVVPVEHDPISRPVTEYINILHWKEKLEQWSRRMRRLRGDLR